MFRRILIANRGEIACRIAKTAREMGVQTVAVHSDIDAHAAHVVACDLSVSLGGATPAESYLRGDAIIEAALATGAEAIHPGYGFLSENPDFVDAVEKAGLIFIGPSAEAIRAMGLKDAAKALMEQAGVPVVPGYHGADQDDATLAKAADEIGYPVLIKAVAGGGGKGMRLVEEAGDFIKALDSARSEAKGAFGNEAVLVEKFVSKPRHIEVQVFGDGKEAVHLYERDCSLQRRHQKVIEEAPAPGMTDEMRAAMGKAAVNAAKAIGYKGAGTVEFIVDSSDGLRPDGFWFMEMNTRLQVEHPVTEAISGVDLVEWQLRVAAGEGLPLTQAEIPLNGHAFEARLYAEDVPAGFLPATGTLEHLSFPQDVRADSGVRPGDAISPFYDPMIAKVIVAGPTRAVALAKLRAGLSNTHVAGTVTNLAFLQALAAHEGFSAGDVDTGLIARDLDALVAMPQPSAGIIALAAIGALGLDQADPFEGFSLWTPLTRAIVLGDHAVRVTVLGAGRYEVTAGETCVLVERDTRWRVDGQVLQASTFVTETSVSVFADTAYHFELFDPLDVEASAGGDASLVEAPMPGLVRAVSVSAGAPVVKGDALVVLEAMKMEHGLVAARDGVVAEVLVTEGTQVEAGAALIRLDDA